MSKILTVFSGSTKTGWSATAENEFIHVSSGGTASNSTVTGGGEMTVYSGGKANTTLLLTNGILLVSTAGT